MNGLSWAIYLVGFVEKIAMTLNVIFPLTITASIFGLIFLLITYLVKQNAIKGDAWNRAITKEAADERYRNIINLFTKMLKYGGAITIIAMTLNLLAPTKQTMVLIAASEVSEAVVTSEMATKAVGEVGGLGLDAMNLLKDYIKSESIDINAKISEQVSGVKEAVTTTTEAVKDGDMEGMAKKALDAAQTAKNAAEAAQAAAEALKGLTQ